MDLSEIRCFPRVQELYDAMEDDYALFFKSVLQTSCIQSTEKKEKSVNLVILLSIRDSFIDSKDGLK